MRVAPYIRRGRQLVLLLSLVVGLWLGVIVMHRNLDPLHHFSYSLKIYDSQQNYSTPYVPEKSREILEGEQVARKKLAEGVCHLSQDHPTLNAVIEEKEQLDHIIVDDEHRLLYCYIPKVACTNWKRLLMVLMGKANTTDPLSILADDSHRYHVFRRLNNYTGEEIRYRLDHYLKFMFVRHPLERLISAYRNKFNSNYTSSEYFRSRYGRQIVRQYRANASEESLARGHDVSFAEFVRYVIDPRTATAQPGGFNEHWKPQYQLCLPCTIRYNLVGKYETLNDDAWLVLEKAGLGWAGGFPRSDRPSSTTPLVEEFTAQLTAQEMLYLYHIYELDFRLFDYPTPPGFN